MMVESACRLGLQLLPGNHTTVLGCVHAAGGARNACSEVGRYSANDQTEYRPCFLGCACMSERIGACSYQGLCRRSLSLLLGSVVLGVASAVLSIYILPYVTAQVLQLRNISQHQAQPSSTCVLAPSHRWVYPHSPPQPASSSTPTVS
jgi:hypothetical protein